MKNAMKPDSTILQTIRQLKYTYKYSCYANNKWVNEANFYPILLNQNFLLHLTVVREQEQAETNWDTKNWYEDNKIIKTHIKATRYNSSE